MPATNPSPAAVALAAGHLAHRSVISSLPDLTIALARSTDEHPLVKDLVAQATRFYQFFAMIEAGWQLDHEADGKKLTDDLVVASFMGNGASDNLTAGDFRKLLAALRPWLRREQ